MKKTVFISGSNRGIGKAMVYAFIKSGYNVVAHARKRDEVLEKEYASVAEENGALIHSVYFDLLDSDAMKSQLMQLRKEKIEIDVLVNNAGVAHGGLFQMTSISTIRDVFNVNFFSHLELTQALLRPMIKKGNACIINVASISGLDSKAGNCAYGTSKAAIIAWTRTLASELGGLGVRVNAIAPGLTDTRMAEQMEEQAGISMISDSAMKRLARTEEIAKVAVFLASEEASFVNGEIIRVDGGMS